MKLLCLSGECNTNLTFFLLLITHKMEFHFLLFFWSLDIVLQIESNIIFSEKLSSVVEVVYLNCIIWWGEEI